MSLSPGKLLLSGLLCAALLTSPGIVYADGGGEIAYLLEAIAQSDCTFIRNGKEHGSVEARDHLAMKYESVKWRIKTSEAFIRKLASGSSISGKPYLIRCDGAEQTSEDWLFKALNAYRVEEKH